MKSLSENSPIYVLVANYKRDKQESMNKFADLLNNGLKAEGKQSEIWTPPLIFGFFFNHTRFGLAKWFGYIDKWIVYPIILKAKISWLTFNKVNFVIHICDHSNSPYLLLLKKTKAGITCHDVLAIRGAMGYKDAYCESTKMGTILQKWIRNNLLKFERIAAVSATTFGQLTSLSKHKILSKKWVVIHNALNEEFEKYSPQKINEVFNQYKVPVNQPFLLHVGSNLPRKNRKLLIDMLSELGDNYNGLLFFAGQDLQNELWHRAAALGLSDRIREIVKPNHELLCALYSASDALIFPSFAEGFGWPILEAQACGAPLLTSNLNPMIEISGGAGLYSAPDDPKGFAHNFLKLKKPLLKQQLIERGYDNLKQFSIEKMIKSYIKLYES